MISLRVFACLSLSVSAPAFISLSLLSLSFFLPLFLFHSLGAWWLPFRS